MKDKRFNITIEEFDAPCEDHVFSERYQQEKARNLSEFKNRNTAVVRAPFVIAAAISLVVATPFVINAATDGEFFARIWGNQGKEDIAAHEEFVYEAEKDSYYTITYPERDYVAIDPDEAQALIGDYVEHPGISREIDGTTVTVLSVVRDDNAAVVELTFEKEGGVDVLNYSQLDNESKGAWFSDDSTFYIDIGSSGNMYVDLERSTAEKLYCYYYARVSGWLDMTIYQYSCTLGERNELAMAGDDAAVGDLESSKTITTISLECEERVPAAEFANADGGIIEISPISMSIDMGTGLGLTYSETQDPFNIYSVIIYYADGSTYIVDQHNTSKFACDVEIANFNYECGSLGTELYYVFNRYAASKARRGKGRCRR